MATWHCPVCGLDFAFHSELDWHIREAHCLKRTAGLAGQLERQAVLDWGLCAGCSLPTEALQCHCSCPRHQLQS